MLNEALSRLQNNLLHHLWFQDIFNLQRDKTFKWEQQRFNKTQAVVHITRDADELPDVKEKTHSSKAHLCHTAKPYEPTETTNNSSSEKSPLDLTGTRANTHERERIITTHTGLETVNIQWNDESLTSKLVKYPPASPSCWSGVGYSHT